MNSKPLTGSILGTAAGDSIGLPFEGMSRSRVLSFCGDLSGHRFVLGRGMVSDDTEHTIMVAQSLIQCGGDVEVFKKDLAWRMRLWLARIPAGVGFATLRAIIKLWLGFGPDRSGVPSAGNGAAMRSPVIGVYFGGVYFGGNDEKLKNFVLASTRMTHTDPRAEWGALAIAVAGAEAAAEAASSTPADGGRYLKRLTPLIEGDGADRFMEAVTSAVRSATAGVSTEDFAEEVSPGGVTGFVMHTVPVAVHAWLSHAGDFEGAVKSVIKAGGDTDTTAAIVGGIAGAAVGTEGIPKRWLEDLVEWPGTVKWMEGLGSALAASKEESGKGGVTPPKLNFPALSLRNLFFLAVVLAHGLRRLLPPYG